MNELPRNKYANENFLRDPLNLMRALATNVLARERQTIISIDRPLPHASGVFWKDNVHEWMCDGSRAVWRGGRAGSLQELENENGPAEPRRRSRKTNRSHERAMRGRIDQNDRRSCGNSATRSGNEKRVVITRCSTPTRISCGQCRG